MNYTKKQNKNGRLNKKEEKKKKFMLLESLCTGELLPTCSSSWSDRMWWRGRENPRTD